MNESQVGLPSRGWLYLVKPAQSAVLSVVQNGVRVCLILECVNVWFDCF